VDAKIRMTVVYGRAYSRWHIAICDARHRCHYVQLVAGFTQLIWITEGVIYGQNR
jgi:hypothetical protein